MKGLLLFKRDVAQGMWKRRIYLLFAPLLVWISCLELSKKWQETKSLYEMKGNATSMDYWIYLIQSKEEWQFNIYHPYQFPVYWLAFFAFLLVIMNTYPSTDLKEWGYQVIVHSKNRWNWWLAKCSWCIGTVAIFFLAALLTVFLYSMANGDKLGWSPSWYVMLSFGREGYTALSVFGRIQIFLLQPFLLAVLLGILQMALSLIIHPLFAFCASFFLLIISTYWKSIFLCGNWGMPYRMSAVASGGLNSTVCLVLLCLSIVICICAGGLLFARKDIYR